MFIKIIKIFNIILTILLLFALGFLLGKKYDVIIDSENKIDVVKQDFNEQKLKKLFTLLDKQYIKEINTDSLIDKTLINVLKDLDPHSSYLNYYEKNKTFITGNYNNIEAELLSINDTIMVARTFPKSINKNTIKIGDKLLKINKNTIVGVAQKKINYLLSKNGNLSLQLLRNNVKVNTNLKIINSNSKNVISSYMINQNVGYLKLIHFLDGASLEVKKHLLSLQRLGANKIILDIRNNGGGLLKEATKITDFFLPKNDIIVYLKNHKNNSKTIYKSNHKPIYTGKTLYVLVNEASASASEVLASAIQDNAVGIIVGRRTFGKGLVQKEITLNDGSKFRITTSEYFTSKGRNIQKEYTDLNTYSYEIINRYKSGEVFFEKPIPKIDTLTNKKGGVYPDIFVGLKPLDLGVTFYEKNGTLLLNSFIINEIKNNIPTYYAYDQEQFINTFSEKNIFNKVLKQFSLNKITIEEKNYWYFKTYIKAYIGKILFGENVYYIIWNKQDEMLKKIFEIEK